MKYLLLTLLLSTSFSAMSAEDNRKYLLLKDAREQIKFKPLSSEERQIILGHAKALFSKIYVNLEHKKILYKTDPLAALAEIEKNYENMSESEFHGKVLAAFTSVRDFHVNYNLPKPYACYASFLPLALQKIEKNKIIVTAVDLHRKNFFNDVDKITPGDELISYKGMAPLSYIESQTANIGASTPDATIVQGISTMYFKGYYGSMLQAEDEVDVEFRKPTGEVYSLTIPFIARYNTDCLKEKQEEKAAQGKNLLNLKIQEIKERKNYLQTIKNKFITFFKNKLPFKKKSLSDELNFVSLEGLNKTAHPNLSWKVINFQGQSFGYLKLDSYDAPQGINSAINEVKKVLEVHLKDTSALVIDLRGNYGGFISFAEKMAALFGAMPVKNLPFYVRANDLVATLLSRDTSWIDLILPQVETNNLVGPGPLTRIEELSKTPQAYFAKVAVLTNSECFSSCDLFAAAMKDYTKVKIYGTDRSTFGGGANVWDSGYLKPATEAASLPALPQGISMRVTGRHAHRLSDNTIIEDRGVPSDEVIREKAEDVLTSNSSVVAKIYRDFLNETRLVKSSDIALKFRKDVLQNHGDENIVLEAIPSHIDYISVFKNKKFINRFEKSADDKIAITLSMKDSTMGLEAIEIYGFDRSSESKKPVLRKSIMIESLAPFKPLSEVDILRDIVLTTFPKNPKCGWKKVENSLVLDGYCDESIMEATLSTQLLNETSELSFDMIMDAEPDFDYYEVSVIEDGKETKLMAPISTPQTGHFTFNLKPFADKKIDLKFKLISDEGFNGKGGSISNIQID